MNALSPQAARKQAESFLDAHPDIQYLDAVVFDMNAIVRGKRYPRADIADLFEKGMLLPYSVMVLDVTGGTSDAGGIGFSDGDPDGILRPVAGTLRPVPWADVPTAQTLVSYDETNGINALLEPRNVLAQVEAQLNADGLFPAVALELEFYLLDAKRTPERFPQAPISPGTGERDTTTQVYGMAELDYYGAILREIEDACHAQNIPAFTASAEYAPGQFEINLKHCQSAVQAADHAALLRRAVTCIAHKHGFRASFMAKPFLELAGNGLHVHVSVLDEKGTNIFAVGDDGVLGNAVLRHAVGGMQATLAQSMAIFAPNVNSYRRFQPNIYVPVSPSWGANNRSLAFRVPSGDADSRRIEHRVAGADANPYLSLATVLAGLHHGIKNKLEPGAPGTGNTGAPGTGNTG
ncbi:MAG: glutamine synthetase, partial [Magnetovibrio sp.]|nr:glutamine synthetase [Magnetovibrio sp.]